MEFQFLNAPDEWHYYMPRKRVTPPSCNMNMSNSWRLFLLTLCVALLALGVGAQPAPPPLPPQLLNAWLLDQPGWGDIFDDPALSYTNINLAAGWDSEAGTSLSVDTNCPALLSLPVVDAYGDTNISLSEGAISFWFQPNFTSVTDGGAGPTNFASLLTIGLLTSNASASCWWLGIDPAGTNLLWLAQSNGASEIVLSASIDFDASDWHNVCLAYSNGGCALYLEGTLVTNAAAIAYLPTASDCATYGFIVGSDNSGIYQARGQFQDLETYGAPLSPQEILWNYARAGTSILNAGGSLPGSGGIRPNYDGPPSPTNGTGGIPMGGTGTPFNPGTNLCLYISLRSNSYASILLSNTVAGDPYLLLAATNLAGPWQTNQFVLATTTTALAAPIPIGETNAVFFRAVQEMPGALKWSVLLGGNGDNLAPDGIDGSPALAADGTIYISTTMNRGSSSNLLFAIDSLTGNVKASNNIFTPDSVSTNSQDAEISSSPAIGPGGKVYIGSLDGHLYSFSNNLASNGAVDLHAPVFASPAIDSGGTIYVGTDDNTAVNTGFISLAGDMTNWFFMPDNLTDDASVADSGANTDVESSSAIGADGTLYFVAEDDRLYALSTNGNIRWFFPTVAHAEPDSSPAIGADGTIYVSGQDQCPFIYAIHPDGSLKWVFDESVLFGINGFQTVQSSPVVGPGQTVYVGLSGPGAENGVVLAVNTNGVLKWMVTLPGIEFSDLALSTPALAADGTVYVGSQDSHLYAITNSGTNAGIEWAFQTGGPIMSSPVIGPDGTIYVGCEDENLYAIYGSSPLATNASWPMFRQNPAHTGAISPSTAPAEDCGAPFVFGGALTTDDSGQPTSFSFNVTATNTGTWFVFASGDLNNWTNFGPIVLTNDVFGDSNGLFVFTTNFDGPITNQYYVLSSGECLSNSCRSRVIGFMNLTYAQGTNLIADQLYDAQNFQFFSPAPMNTPNELFGALAITNLGILKWNGAGFDVTTNAPFGIGASEWIDSGNDDLDFHSTLLPGSSALFVNGSAAAFTFPFVGLIRTQQVYQIQAGTNFLAAPLPVAGNVTNITGYASHTGDIVQLWDTNRQVFKSFTNSGGTWSPSNPAVRIGEGFVLVTTSASRWTNTWSQTFPCSGP